MLIRHVEPGKICLSVIVMRSREHLVVVNHVESLDHFTIMDLKVVFVAPLSPRKDLKPYSSHNQLCTLHSLLFFCLVMADSNQLPNDKILFQKSLFPTSECFLLVISKILELIQGSL